MIKLFKIIIQIIKLISLILKIKFINNKIGLEKKIKICIEEMGPVFIKFAQIISVRTDLFSKNIIKELEKLQTHTKNINFLEIKKKIKTIDKNLNDDIKKINENPLASASIAQIHTAVLKNNKRIVIKFLKPGIKNTIKYDMMVIYIISKIMMFFFKKFERLKLIDLIDELKNTLENEVDLKKESSNIKKMKEDIKDITNVYIPNTYFNLKHDDILITEYLDGINIKNKEKIIKNNINSTELIKILLNLFYKQVFEHDIFHADLHPGNILISKTNLNKPIIILLDFGIIGNLNNDEKIYLSENIIAFAKKDYKKVINIHLKANTIKFKKNIKDMEKELSKIFIPISDKKLKDIELKKIIISLIKLSKIFNMQLQPNLVLFQKTLFSIEGLSRYLDINVNLWQLTRNVMEKIIINKIFNINNIANTENKSNKNYHKNINKTYHKFFSNFFLIFLNFYIITLIILNIIIKYQIIIFFLV
ncbi:MAG TPA: ABC1 kinase family protein [Candidatus Azoamicus sp.]